MRKAEVMTKKATRRSPRGEARRADIIATATEEFATKGYRGASLAAIADRVGISQSGLLHHYATKDILLDAVVQQRFAEDAALVDHWGLGEHSPLAGYDKLINRNIQDPMWVQFLMVIMAEGLTEDHPAHELIRVRYARVRERMKQRILAHAGDRYDLPGGLDRDVLVVLFLAALDGLQLQWLYDDTIDMQRVIRMMIGLINGDTTGAPTTPEAETA